MGVYTLANGTSISIRAVRPDDAPCIQDGFGRLSPESIYKRFFTMKSSLTEDELRYLTSCDGVDHVGFIVHRLDNGQEQEGIAVGRWIREANNPRVAHAAFIVVDDWQRLGIGTLLAQELAASSLASEIEFWHAESWADNAAGHFLLKKVGEIERLQTSGGIAEMLVRLTPKPV